MFSEESDDEPDEVDVYKKKFNLIRERCEIIKQDNERLVNRIHHVKKMLLRGRKERKESYGLELLDKYQPRLSDFCMFLSYKMKTALKIQMTLKEPDDFIYRFLMDKLDLFGDNWRNVPLPLQLTEPMRDPSLPNAKTASKSTTKGQAAEKGNKKGQTGVKRKGHKIDKNAPKRPANPYFQFCQEQRNSAIEEMASTGQADPSKVEVTKHLANKWNALTQDDKKVYYDMYEKSKERYAADMQVYTQNKKKEAAAIAATTDIT